MPCHCREPKATEGRAPVQNPRRQVGRVKHGVSPFSICVSFDRSDEPRVVLADLACLDKGPGTLLIETPKILLHLGDVGFEIPQDQIGIGPHVLIALRQERSLRRNAGSCGSSCAHDQGCRCQDQSLRTASQGKTPLPALR